MTNGSVPADWYRDPTGPGDARYWNGGSWTESVDQGGVTVNVAIDSSQAPVPPVPGTQVSIPRPAPAAQTVNMSSRRGSLWSAILGQVVVLLVVIGILVVLSNYDSSDASPTPADPATEAPAAPATGG